MSLFQKDSTSGIPDTENELWQRKKSSASSIGKQQADKRSAPTSTNDHDSSKTDGKTRQKHLSSNSLDRCNIKSTTLQTYGFSLKNKNKKMKLQLTKPYPASMEKELTALTVEEATT